MSTPSFLIKTSLDRVYEWLGQLDASRAGQHHEDYNPTMPPIGDGYNPTRPPLDDFKPLCETLPASHMCQLMDEALRKDPSATFEVTPLPGLEPDSFTYTFAEVHQWNPLADFRGSEMPGGLRDLGFPSDAGALPTGIWTMTILDVASTRSGSTPSDPVDWRQRTFTLSALKNGASGKPTALESSSADPVWDVGRYPDQIMPETNTVLYGVTVRFNKRPSVECPAAAHNRTRVRMTLVTDPMGNNEAGIGQSRAPVTTKPPNERRKLSIYPSGVPYDSNDERKEVLYPNNFYWGWCSLPQRATARGRVPDTHATFLIGRRSSRLAIVSTAGAPAP